MSKEREKMGEQILALFRFVRNSKRLTQREVAQGLGMSQAGYSLIEIGRRSLDIDKLDQIAQFYKLNASDFVRACESDAEKAKFYQRLIDEGIRNISS